ncbi:MAG TPA: response regulator transcription factor [Phycisphaerae bacterium]|nr:response regulator transcription factor [Phycisphaerae bacterium]
MNADAPTTPSDMILIVEDDPTLLRGLVDNFRDEGYRVRTARDGQEAIVEVRRAMPDLILLDIMLPKVNGYEVCRRIREKNPEVPIIMLTAKGQEPDIVLGLNLGADDYVTKPFGIAELLARVRAFLRRTHQHDRRACRFGDCRLDFVSHRLTRAGREVPLTPKEFGVLSLLARQAGRAFTRDDILAAVWGDDLFVTRRSVDRCINTLRGKIEPNPRSPTFLHTVRDLGYRFEVDDSGSP